VYLIIEKVNLTGLAVFVGNLKVAELYIHSESINYVVLEGKLLERKNLILEKMVMSIAVITGINLVHAFTMKTTLQNGQLMHGKILFTAIFHAERNMIQSLRDTKLFRL